MVTPLPAIDIPLRQDPDGSLRIGETRVTLDVVIALYNNGSSADDIARKIDVLNPADVHLVIGYYLGHKAEVDAYLASREAHADVMEREWRARSQQDRATLEARRVAKKKGGVVGDLLDG
jgi:uncharacterized protein (DUF433 family)